MAIFHAESEFSATFSRRFWPFPYSQEQEEIAVVRWTEHGNPSERSTEVGANPGRLYCENLGGGQTSILWLCDESHRQRLPAGNWALAEQPGPEFAPSISTMPTGHATISKNAKFAGICYRERLGSQPLQSAAPPSFTRQLQVQPRGCSF